MTAARRPRCADAARERADPALGTAPLIRRWLLVEHPGPWPVQALRVPELTAALRAEFAAAAGAVTGRILLIRRPGRADREPTERRWAVVDDEGVQWGGWREPTDLHAAVAAFRRPGQRRPEPLLLVCAHGTHDTCCAVRGRPVAAALARTWPDASWECSHVGGDRFAPNLIVLPDGTYYGNLDTESAVAVVRRHLAGEVSADHLRGLPGHPPAVQVAIGTAHRRWGPFGVDDVTVRQVSRPAPDRWEIELGVPRSGVHRITVVTSDRPPARLTCRAALDTCAVEYRVLDRGDGPDARSGPEEGRFPGPIR